MPFLLFSHVKRVPESEFEIKPLSKQPVHLTCRAAINGHGQRRQCGLDAVCGVAEVNTETRG